MRKMVVYKKTVLGTEEGFTGTFHGFFQCGNNEDGFEVVAVVEDEDGRIFELNTNWVKFVPEDK
jgi:hypothetical protein